jgi:hypothetical protein
MRNLKYALVAAAAFGAAGFASDSASAKAKKPPSMVQDVRWVCDAFGCRWQPACYGYGYYGCGDDGEHGSLPSWVRRWDWSDDRHRW